MTQDEIALKALNAQELMQTSEQKHQSIAQEKHNQIVSERGWHNLSLEQLFLGGSLYPKDTRIMIKPASIETIKHYSSMNEDDFNSIQSCIDLVLSESLKVWIDSKETTPEKLFIWDKIFLLLKIREYNFPDHEKNGLSWEVKCPKCKTEQKVIMTPGNLVFHKPDSNFLKKYSRDWGLTIKTDIKNLEIDYPTIEKQKFIQKFVINNPGFLNEKFLEFVPYMRIGELNEKNLKDVYINTFVGWNLDELSLWSEAIKRSKGYLDQKISYKCKNKKCGQEVDTQIRFPNGLRNIFFVQDLTSRFL